MMFINDNDIEKIKKNQKDKPNKKEVTKKKDITLNNKTNLDNKNVNIDNLFSNRKSQINKEIPEIPKEKHINEPILDKEKEIDNYSITSDDEFTYQEDNRNIIEKLDYIANKNDKKFSIKNFLHGIRTFLIIAIVGIGIYLVFAYTQNNVDIPFTSIGLIEGSEYQLKTLIYGDKDISYSVSETAVISLDETQGIIKGFSEGEAKVKVKVGKDTEKIKVYVVKEKVPIENFEIDKNIVVKVDKQTIIPITCTPDNTTELNFNYTSRDTNIATVDNNGIITGVSVGSTSITITNNKISKNITVVVK